MIFDDCERDNPGPKLNIESDFAFLNRSSRAEMAEARERLEELLSDYPDQQDLVARFRSGNNQHFRSAEFELLIFSYLSKLGFKLSPHPELDNGSESRPDFLVESPNGDAFYLEAVLASEDTDDRTGDPLLATTLDIFSTASHDNFTLIVHTAGYPSTQPSRKRLLRKTLGWLDSLNPELVQSQIDAGGYDSAPTLCWQHEGLEIRLQALPIPREKRGKSSRLLGVQFGQAGWVDSWSAIRDAIKFKGSKYGLLEKPLIVAVNFHGRHLDRMDEMQALFGQEQIVFSPDNPDIEPRTERAANGAWAGKGGPTFTRVTGTWLFDNLCIYNIPSRNPTLYVNPWSRLPLPQDLLQVPHAIGIDGQMNWHPGVSPGDALGIQ